MGYLFHIIIFLPIYVTIWLLCGSVYGVICMLKGYESDGSVFRNNWEFTKAMLKQFKFSTIIVILILISLSLNITTIVKEKRFSYDYHNYIQYHVSTIESNFSYSVRVLANEVRAVKDYLEGHSDYYRDGSLDAEFDYSRHLNSMIRHGKQYDYYLQQRHKGYKEADFIAIEKVYKDIFENINEDIVSGEKTRIDKAIQGLEMVYNPLWGYNQRDEEFSAFIKEISSLEEGR